jgi:citrate synthase
VNGEEVPCPGRLFYRGYDVKDLVKGFWSEGYFGFEETAFLLLFGYLPSEKELKDFEELLTQRRVLPPNFVRDVIMKAPSRDMMNSLSRSVLMLYTYDKWADDTSTPNVLRQCLNLISQFPMLMVYGYHAYNYRKYGEDMYIYSPQPGLSTAENILLMLRPDKKYSSLEARVLDMALVLHMDHGGGNNSTFATHVVTSSGTDTYSTVAAALASLKGPKHGGANVKVVDMFDDLKENISDWNDEEQIGAYLERVVDKEAFDGKGLIYGMGHAVYSISDPREELLKEFARSLADEKGCPQEYALYETVERLAPQIIAKKRKIYKGVNANVDFYSGLVYSMLGLPKSLYTPIFATARIVGWSAHRLEELKNSDKIIRPAYRSLAEHRDYIRMEDRRSSESDFREIANE